MSKLKRVMCRIIGCLEIALVCALLFGGMISFAIMMLFNADVCINAFVVVFIMTISMLLACVSIYAVNPTLWNTVHDKREDLILFRMIPDICVIVELVDYMTESHKD